MAATARAFVLSRFWDLSLRPRQPPQPPPPPAPPSFSRNRVLPLLQRHRFAKSPPAKVCCLISGVDGGGVSDEFVSTRRSSFDRGFSVIANMLKRIEPLDTSVISKGVSDSAKDSMKETISTMLGLLPSDQFSVTVNVSKGPLDRLLVSSIITGYTLWNAEYRISLMRNFDIPVANSEKLKGLKPEGASEREEIVEKDGETGFETSMGEFETLSPQVFGNLSPEALNYIQRLQSELSNAKEELNARKQENVQIEYSREHRNDLLDYLRSLDSNMVIELSKPSSLEVEEIIHQLVKNISQTFFKDDSDSNFMGESVTASRENLPDGNDEFCNTVGTSRDYLAKLLFW
ncbi:seed maturation-like protein [Parasponia andersonii]|uniref:Seed maturation-like protein n=1 Tax=Parasponia andersonii TaxID=3476 RepID=A0A2P5CEB2_PARAD|nr:seed maturation-like protein [Parasponia andersonii]